MIGKPVKTIKQPRPKYLSKDNLQVYEADPADPVTTNGLHVYICSSPKLHFRNPVEPSEKPQKAVYF